jgi:hypothetical protein
MYFILNLAVGGNFPGQTIDESRLPAAFSIDYVRVYQQVACTPSAITPYYTINGGAWQSNCCPSLAVGSSISFGPQPLDAGTWSWTGPNGFSANTRTPSINNIQSNQAGSYVASFTNSGGCTSTYTFNVTVTGGGSYTSKIEAENYTAMAGVQLETCSEGGSNVGYIDAGDWMAYNISVPTAGTYKVSYRVASIYAGKTLRLEKDNGATLLGTVTVPNTGNWQGWATVAHNVSLPAGSYAVGLATATGGFNINWFEITNTSLARLAAPEVVSTTESNTSFYPNPVSSKLNYKLPEGITAHNIQIRDFQGKAVSNFSFGNVGSENAIDLSSLKAGFYIIRITDKGFTKTFKIEKN